MSISVFDEYLEYIDINNTNFYDLLNKLYFDINYNNNINWIHNRFISSDLYYDLIEKLDTSTKIKFNKINKNITLPTKSNLSLYEIESMYNDFCMYNNNEYILTDESIYDDIEDINLYDNSFDKYKKLDKDQLLKIK